MKAVRLCTRAALRRGWPGIVAVALLVGLGGGAVLAAVAGARRTETAAARLYRKGSVADVEMDPTTQALGVESPDIAKLRQIPQVKRVTTASFFALAVRKKDGSPGDLEAYVAANGDGSWIYKFDRIGLVPNFQGRLPDPKRDDEVVATRQEARLLHVGLGDTLPLAVAKFDDPNAEAPSSYSPITLHIVGIATTPIGLLRGGDATETYFFATPAFYRRFASSNLGSSIYVQLHHPDDLDAFERAVARVTAGTTFQLKPARQELATFARVASPYTTTLWLFALVAAVATMLIVAQALVRMVRIDATAGSDLRALGTTSTQRASVAAVRALLAVTLGACIAVVVAVAVSPLFPLGLVHRVEPDPGVRVDGVVLLLGALAIVVALGGVALVVARWATRSSYARSTTSPGSRSFVGSALDRANLPLSIASGARFAFSRGRNNAGVSATASIVGLVAAIAATSAALVFGANLDQLQTPSRYGQTWDAEIISGSTTPLSPSDLEHRLASRSLAAGTIVGTFGDVTLDGQDVPASGVEPHRGRAVLVAAKGRLPAGPGEIALGARTLRQLHRSVGDRVAASTSDGRREQLQIVGQVLLPSLNSNTPTLGADDGALLTRQGLVRLNPDLGDEVDFVLVALAPHKTLAQLRSTFASNDFTVTGAAPPSDIASYNNVESTPLVLAGLLTILGIGVLAHLLVTSVRRSRRDLAIFKTLGCTRRQLMLMVVWQALMLVFTALVAGLVIGLLVGRDVWIRFADGLGLAPTVDLPSLRIAAVVIAGLAFAVVIAWMPARSATRVAPARVLRTE